MMPMSMSGTSARTRNLPFESIGSKQTIIYPSILRAVATGGDIRMGPDIMLYGSNQSETALLLAPSTKGQLELLAGGSIIGGAGRADIMQSGADTLLPSPFNPAFGVFNWPNIRYGNLSSDGIQASAETPTLFAFGPNTVTNRSPHLGDLTPARFYAVNGDIIGLNIGEITPPERRHPRL